MRSLRDWELATHDDGITRSELVAQCTALMRVAFDLKASRSMSAKSLSPEEGEPRFPSGAALRYMVLGALGYLHDSVPHVGAIGVEAEGADALRFLATARRCEPAGSGGGCAPGAAGAGDRCHRAAVVGRRPGL